MRKIFYFIIAFLFFAECNNDNQENVKNITVTLSKISKEDEIIILFKIGENKVLKGSVKLDNLAAHLHKQMHIIVSDIFGGSENQNISFNDFYKKCTQRLAEHYTNPKLGGLKHIKKFLDEVVDKILKNEISGTASEIDGIFKQKEFLKNYIKDQFWVTKITFELFDIFSKSKFSGWIISKTNNGLSDIIIERGFLKDIIDLIDRKKENILVTYEESTDGYYKKTYEITVNIPLTTTESKYSKIYQATKSKDEYKIIRKENNENINIKIIIETDKREKKSIQIGGIILSIYPY